MRIKLENFGCHVNALYEIPDNGLILISGDSGSGKSTLLRAILYALFGSTAVKKPYTFGKSKCKVSLEFLDLKITRTNRPNRLIVNRDFEDDAAQELIYEKLGANYEEFLVSSYIQQKNNNSILSISQNDQLKMIKTLSFDRKHENYREKIMEMIHESTKLLTERRAHQLFINREIERLKEDLKPVKFPLSLDGKDRQTAIADFQTRLRSFGKKITEYTEKKTELYEKLCQYSQKSQEMSSVNEKLDSIKERVTILYDQQVDIKKRIQSDPVNMEKRIRELEGNIKYSDLKKEYKNLRDQFDQIMAGQKQERDTQQKELVEQLWTHDDRETSEKELSVIREKITLCKEYSRAQKKFSDIKKRYQLEDSDLEKLIKTHQQLYDRTGDEKERLTRQREHLNRDIEKARLEKTVLHCPECDAFLCLREDTLVSVQVTKEHSEEALTEQLRELECNLHELAVKRKRCSNILRDLQNVNIPKLNFNYETCEKLTEMADKLALYIAANIQREATLERIIKVELTPALKKLKQNILAKKSAVKKLAANGCQNKDTTEMQKELLTLERELTDYNKNTADLKKVQKELDSLERGKIDAEQWQKKLQEFLAQIDEKSLAKDLDQLERDLEELQKKQEQDELVAPILDDYLKYRDQKQELTRWKDQSEESNKKVANAEKMHAANTTLKDRYTQAEVMALEETIESINEHTRYYTDTFFSDCISISLKAVGVSNKMKKIETRINFKGNEYDNIHQLSGGEFDRCTLASVCGVNSMIGSPMLILDESLASLDTANNTEILKFLGQLAQEKLVLVCSHEAVQGIFDHIVTI